MLSPMPRLFRIRRAKNVPADVRQTCERFGANVIAHMLAAGLNPRYISLQHIYNAESNQERALEWLTEQYDRAERKENWSLIMEIAITVFVFAELHPVKGTIELLDWIKTLVR